MLKKYFVIFVILTVSFFFLYTGIFGQNGMLANAQLKKQLAQKEYEISQLNSTIENLQQKNYELSTEEGIREAALKLGYNVSGDEVYVFDTPSLQDSDQSNLNNKNSYNSYKPLSKGLIFLISVITSALITFFIHIILNKKSEEDSSNGIE